MSAYAVHEGGHKLEHLSDRFDVGIKDPDWIAAIAAEDERWTVVCGDNKILRKQDEVAALVRSDLSYFFLRGGWWDQSFHTIAVKFLKIWPKLVQSVAETRVPSIWEVPVSSDKLQLIDRTKAYGRK